MAVDPRLGLAATGYSLLTTLLMPCLIRRTLKHEDPFNAEDAEIAGKDGGIGVVQLVDDPKFEVGDGATTC